MTDNGQCAFGDGENAAEIKHKNGKNPDGRQPKKRPISYLHNQTWHSEARPTVNSGR